MLLTIHNLPAHFTHANIKSLLLEKCGLTKLILDELVAEGGRQQVTVGLADEGDAAVLVRKINGLFLNGQHLHVKDVNKTKASEQPYHSTKTYQHGNEFMEGHDKNPYLDSNQSLVMQQQGSVMNQPVGMPNMMQYNAAFGQHQMLDRNTMMTQNTMMVQGDMLNDKSLAMQYAAAMTQQQMQMAGMNYNMSQNYLMGYNKDMEQIPGMVANPFAQNNSQFGNRQNVGGFDNDEHDRNGTDSRRKRKRSRQKNSWPTSTDYGGRQSRSPPRDTSRGNRYSRFDQQATNDQNIRRTFPSTENDISNFDAQPNSDYQQPFDAKYSFNSMEQFNRSSTFQVSNNFVDHGADKNFGKRYKSSNRSLSPLNQFEDQGNESFENAQRQYGNNQEFSGTYEYQQTPQNFGENKVWQHQIHDRSESDAGFVNRNNSFVQNAGRKTRNPSRWDVPYKANDDGRPNQSWKNKANSSFARTDGPPKARDRKNFSRWDESLASPNQAKFANEEKKQWNKNTDGRMKNFVPKANTGFARKDFKASTKAGNSAGFPEVGSYNYSNATRNERRRNNAVNKDETAKGQAAAGLSWKLMNKFFKPEMLDNENKKKFLAQLKQCIRLRIDVVMGTELAKTAEEIVRAYGSIFHMKKDKTFFFAVFEKFMKESAPESQEVNDQDPLMIEAKKLVEKSSRVHDSSPAVVPTGVKQTKSFKVLKRLTEKEFEKGAFKLTESQDQVLNEELSEVSKKILESLQTENPEEEKIIKKLNENSADAITRALRKEVTKRILNISDGLAVRVFCKPSFPRVDQLKRVLKSYDIVHIKKSEKARTYWVHLKNWKEYDRLINTGFTVLDGITYTFKAPDMTNINSKPTRDELLQFRKELANKQIAYMEDKLKLDFNIDSGKVKKTGIDTEAKCEDSEEGKRDKAGINDSKSKDNVIEDIIDCDAIVKDCDDVIIEENPEHEIIHEVPDSDDRIEENDNQDEQNVGDNNESGSPHGHRVEMFGNDQMLVLDECKDDDDDDFDADKFIENLDVDDIGADELEDY